MRFFIQRINKIPTSLFLFILLGGCYLSLAPNPNEEYYLGQAKLFSNPEWIKNSFSFGENSGSRLLFNFLLYPFFRIMDFPQVVFVGRLFLIIGMVFPLAKIYKLANLNNLAVLLHLPFLFLAKQSYFAGSWIFLSVESKCIAYVFVFWMLYFLMVGKYKYGVICLITATYFHILVGLWSTLYFIITLFFVKDSSIQIKLKLLAFYIIAVLPLILYLKGSVLNISDTTPSADYIYSYYRNAHHTALAPSWKHFTDIHLNGVLQTFIALIISVITYPRITKTSMKKMILFLIITLSITLLLVIVSFVDSEGTILKYYLYRINTLSRFIFLLLIIFVIWDRINQRYLFILNTSVLIVGLYSAFNIIQTNIGDNLINAHLKDKNLGEIAGHIRQHTEQSATVLYLTEENEGDGDLSLVRQMERDRLAVFKFVPAQMNLLYVWYQRLLIRNRIRNNIDYLDTGLEKYQINYVLSDKPLFHIKLDLAYQKGPYFFYSVVEN